MSWRDRLGHATFRGVPFFVESGERSGGRSAVVHEYPFSEEPPFTEDLGRQKNSYAVTGYVIGEEYTTARDALLRALHTEGPGELVHPYYGTCRVIAGPAPYRLSESTREGGMATFSIEFTETAATATQPVADTDHGAVLQVGAAAVKTSLRARFLSAFSAVTNLRASAAQALQAVSSAVEVVLTTQALAEQEMAALRVMVEDLAENAEALASAPEELIDSLFEVIEALGEGVLTVVGSVDPSAEILKLFSFNPGVRPPETTPNREVERANYDAIQQAVQRLVLAQASIVVIEQSFVSYQDAVRVRSAIVDLIDVHVETVADDTFSSLMDLRVGLVRAVPGEDSDLPEIVRHTPPATTPSLVLAHQLYGDLDREEDLVRRNHVKNPGFIPGGAELEVLSS